jgi:hypothetical protein
MRQRTARGSIAMTKHIAAITSLFIGSLVAWFISRKSEVVAGENEHQELYRLREEISRLYYLLVLANGLLCAIFVALVF